MRIWLPIVLLLAVPYFADAAPLKVTAQGHMREIALGDNCGVGNIRNAANADQTAHGLLELSITLLEPVQASEGCTVTITPPFDKKPSCRTQSPPGTVYRDLGTRIHEVAGPPFPDDLTPGQFRIWFTSAKHRVSCQPAPPTTH